MQLTYIDLDRRVAHYRAHRLLNPRQWKAFEDKLTLSWLYHDYALEGVPLTHEEVERALHHDIPRHHCDAIQLDHIRQTALAMDQVSQAPHRPCTLALEDLKQFHVMLCLPGSHGAGRYRKNESLASPYNHTVTKPASISYRLRRLVETLDEEMQDMHPVRAAALAHHEFMSIWPFDHKSGTAARLFMNDRLLRAGYPPAIIHAADRQLYYDALEQDPEAMVSVVRHALETTLRCSENFFRQNQHQIA